ncbi:hypothetical protein V6N13_129816 [Hibiscus sabdariffa]
MALLGLASAWPVLWMVDFSVGVEHPGVSNPGVLSLGEFPHLVLGTAETISREAVDGIVAGNMVPGSKAVGEATGDAKSGEGLRDLEKDMKSLFSGQTFSFYPPVENESKIFVQPPREVLDLGAKQWDNALLGNFLGKSPPLGIFQRTTDKLWGREGSVEIRFLAPSVYLINFPSQRMRDWILESGPWHIQQKALILSKWLPGMIPDVISLDSAPIWVKLWHIPLELYSRQGLGYLASALGKPLYTNRSTALKKQLEYAKICVDVEAKTVLPASITVDFGNGNCVDVGVELDWAPPCCSNCVVFGHSTDNWLGVELGVVSPQAVRVDGVGEGSSAQLVPGSVPPSFGQTLEDERVDLVSGQDGVSNISANKFEVLCAVVDDQVVKDFLTRPERVVVGGVAELMEKLKPKEKGKVAKKKGKGRGAVKDMGFEGCASPSFG